MSENIYKRKNMKNTSRYMLIIIGSSENIQKDLLYVADKRGVSYIDGKGMFMGTFYSPLSVEDIHNALSHRPAFTLFDITNPDSSAINLPDKYYKALFPETLNPKSVEDIFDTPSTTTGKNEGSVEFQTVDEILDKLSRNNYNMDSLTEGEKKILESESNK